MYLSVLIYSAAFFFFFQFIATDPHSAKLKWKEKTVFLFIN